MVRERGPPNPSHNGAGNSVEAVLYGVTACSLLGFVSSVAGALLLPAVARPFLPKRVPLVLFLPLACWVAALAILTVDPFGAMNFWLD